MRALPGLMRAATGAMAPKVGVLGPALAIGLALTAIGCGDSDETQTMNAVALGMTSDMAASYDDGELTMFEVKLPVQLRISRPTQEERQALHQDNVAPYGRSPWITTDDVEVQVSWTLTNLDPDAHAVEILVDPWNEFGRYWPGLALVDADREEFLPNLSGIDILMELPGTDSGGESRRRGTFTYQDMNELAIDLATVMNIIENGPTADPANPEEDPSVMYANHAFAVENRSFSDPLVQPYIPGVIAGLTGFDIGLRTYEPANLAIELVVEVLDKDSGKVVERDSDREILDPPDEYITVGFGG